MTPAEIVDANDEKAVRINRFSWANHIVPPTGCLIVWVMTTSNMVVTR